MSVDSNKIFSSLFTLAGKKCLLLTIFSGTYSHLIIFTVPTRFNWPVSLIFTDVGQVRHV